MSGHRYALRPREHGERPCKCGTPYKTIEGGIYDHEAHIGGFRVGLLDHGARHVYIAYALCIDGPDVLSLMVTETTLVDANLSARIVDVASSPWADDVPQGARALTRDAVLAKDGVKELVFGLHDLAMQFPNVLGFVLGPQPKRSWWDKVLGRA